MRRALGAIGPFLLLSCTLSCTAAPPAPERAAPRSVVEAFAAAGPEVQSLLRSAGSLPRVTANGVAVATRGLALDAGPGFAFELHGESTFGFRVEGLAGAPRVEDRHVVFDGPTPTVAFDRGAAIEILHRLAAPAPLSYVVELPAGHTLKRTEDGLGGTVEIVDRGGVPRARVTADAAWDRDGRRVPVSLRVSGARIDVKLPAEAAYPVVVDPTWSAATFPTRLRSGHTATLMGNGEVLLAGGGSATAEVYEIASGRFRPVGPMSDGRPGHAAALLPNGKVMIVGGGSLSTTEIYDPQTRAFSAGPTMTTVSGRVVATRLAGGRVLLTRSNDWEGKQTAERFDPTTSTWTALTKKTSAGGPIVPLANGNVLLVGEGIAEIYRAAVGDFVAVAAPAEVSPALLGAPLRDGRALLYGITGAATSTGSDFTFSKGAWTFDPATNAFVRRGDVAQPALGSAGTTLPSGKVLYVGVKAQVFDPTSHAWSTAEDLPFDHDGATATVLPTGSVLVAGGRAGGATAYVASDAAGAGTWSTTGPLSIGRIGGRTTRLLDGRVLFAGGTPPEAVTPDGRRRSETYDPSKGTWTTAGALVADRISHAQVLLRSGKVLLAGGSGASSAELFDPATGASTATGSLSVVREGASATLLPSGKALIAGGSGTSTAELYDEATGKFTVLPSTMSAPHAQHGAVLLGDGRVLIIDGQASELFDPSTETFTKGPALSAERDGRTASLLPNGDVVIGGKSLTLPLERWDQATSAFSLAGPIVKTVRGQSAAGLPFGRVLFGFGTDAAGYATQGSAWIFDPLGEDGRGATAQTGNAPVARRETIVTPLARGGLLVAGGDGCAAGCFGDPSTTTAVFEPWGPPIAERAAIAKAPATIAPGVAFELEGTRFVGSRETSASSSTRAPTVAFVPASGQGTVIGTVTAFSDVKATVRLPATALHGKGFLHVSVAGVTGPGTLVEVAAATNGVACAVAADCASGFCVDGVCCDAACDGVCQACTTARKGSGADGACGAIPPGKDAKDACALFQGAPCAADGECASGICADGVCCDARCTGQCEACNAEGSAGKCVPVVGAPKGPRPACDAGGDVCAARTCDGTARASCEGFAPSTTACRPASCVDGVETLSSTCDGKGTCPSAVTKACEPFACGDQGCLTRCTADSECAASYRCVAGKCVTGAYCANDRTLQAPGAPDVDCSPYRCEGDGCKASCGSSLDCVGGFLCSDGKCVAASGSPPPEEGGCTMGSPRGSTSALLLLLVAAALTRARRRIDQR
ncbi:MAG: hypothetical protein HYV09_25110 [Deltaproteobacteria bacterium]|nr:hypothetical protein [Deltaproteobacteria bacterium]